MAKELTRAIRAQDKTCASYEDGYCLTDDCPCHALNPKYTIRDGGIDCDYFQQAVLPSDRELHDLIQAEIYSPLTAEEKATAPVQIRKCVRCGKHYTPRSNRQQYCSLCGVEAQKERDRAKHRRQYWKDSHPLEPLV